MQEPLERRLRELRPITPPPGCWVDIQRRYRREKRVEHLRRWLPLAAAAGFALVFLPGPQGWQLPVPSSSGTVEVQRLQQRSAELEAALAALPRRPATRSALPGARIGLVEAQIAAIDTQLNRAAASRRAAPLWRERVDLMGELVQARYLEAGAQSY